MLAHTEWIRADPAGHAQAERARAALGTWPQKLVKTFIYFDPSETRTYGTFGSQTSGGELSLLASKIVLAARDEGRLLYALKGFAAALIAPMIAYLRVNYAMIRLEETINQSCHSGPRPAGQEGGTHAETDGALSLGVPDKPTVFRDDKIEKPRPTFRWRKSPASTYKFSEQTEKLGYDPRDTSVHWIERRASRLRRQWAAQRTHSSEIKIPRLKSRRAGHETTRAEDADASVPLSAPIIKEFVPAKADYGTIWPPVAWPDAPPKTTAPKSDAPKPNASKPVKAAPVTSTEIAADATPGTGAKAENNGTAKHCGHEAPQSASGFIAAPATGEPSQDIPPAKSECAKSECAKSECGKSERSKRAPPKTATHAIRVEVDSKIGPCSPIF